VRRSPRESSSNVNDRAGGEALVPSDLLDWLRLCESSLAFWDNPADEVWSDPNRQRR